MKPKMTLNMIISVDCSQKQRYTEEEIMLEFANNNIRIDRKLVVRKTDGVVMGEILIENFIKTHPKICSNCGYFDLTQTTVLPKEYVL